MPLSPEENAVRSEHVGLAVSSQVGGQQTSIAARILEALRWRTAPDLKPGPGMGNRCNSVALAHLVTGVSGDQAPAHIYTRQISEKLTEPLLDEQLVTIAEDLTQQAVWHADTFERLQAYAVVLYAKSDTVLQQVRFNVGKTVRQLAIGGETEPPTEMGMTAQHMRHTEVAMRMMLESQHQAFHGVSEENDRLRTETQSLRAELAAARVREDDFRVVKEALLDGKAKRDLEMEEMKQWAERGERVMAVLEKQIFPALVAKYGTEHPVAEQVKSFSEGLRPEQVTEFLAVLDPAQQASLWKLIPEKKQQEIQAKMAMAGANGVADPTKAKPS